MISYKGHYSSCLSCCVYENIFSDIPQSRVVSVQEINLKIEVHGHGSWLDKPPKQPHLPCLLYVKDHAGSRLYEAHGAYREKNRERSNKTTKINSGQQFRVHDGGVDVTPG